MERNVVNNPYTELAGSKGDTSISNTFYSRDMHSYANNLIFAALVDFDPHGYDNVEFLKDLGVYYQHKVYSLTSTTGANTTYLHTLFVQKYIGLLGPDPLTHQTHASAAI